MKLNLVVKHLLIILIAAWLLVTASASLLIIIFGHWDGPWRDMWEAVPWLHTAHNKHFLWQDLWADYGNSHRFYIAKLIWLADWLISGGNNHLIIAISFVCQLVIFLIFYHQFKHIGLTRRQLFLSACLLIFYLLNPSQIFNFLYTFDVQWFLVTLCTVASCFLLRRNEHQYWRMLMVVMLLIVVGGNNFSGLVVIPLLLLLMIKSRYTPLALCLYVVFIAVFLFFYMRGLPAVSTSVFGIAAGLERVSFWQAASGLFVVFIAFPLTYLASPFSYLVRAGDSADWFDIWLSCLPMLLVATVIALVTVRLFSRYQTLSMTERFAGSVFTFCLAVALVTSFGRAWFFEIAYAERFQNIVLLFWMSVALLFIHWWRYIGLRVMLVIAFLFHGLSTFEQLNSSLIHVNRTANAHAAIYTGIVDKLNVLQATISRYNLYGSDTPYSMAIPVEKLKQSSVGMFQQSQWQAPTLSEQLNAALCDTHFVIDNHWTQLKGQVLYIVGQETSPSHGVWFIYQHDELKALLLPRRSDEVLGWLYQIVKAPNSYEGFTEALDLLGNQTQLKLYKRTRDGSVCFI